MPATLLKRDSNAISSAYSKSFKYCLYYRLIPLAASEVSFSIIKGF